MEKILNGKYKILKKIKDGGFSSVYLAQDMNLDVEVVLKRYNPEEFAEKLGVQGAKRYSVEREIKEAVKYNHSNIVRYFDFFTLNGQDSFGSTEYEVGVMEYVDGGTIKEYVKKNRYKEERVDQVILGLFSGLAYLHEKGVIHRDIKAGNVLVNKEGVTKIIDFGISKQIDNRQSTQKGHGESMSLPIGTKEYLSPEQLDESTFGVKGTISTQVDVWMCGVLLYYIFKGTFPFGKSGNDKQDETLRKNIMTQEARGLDFSSVPDKYHELIIQCLTKKASERPTISEIIELFESSSEPSDETTDPTEQFEAPRSSDKGQAQSPSDLKKYLPYLLIPIMVLAAIWFGKDFFSATDADLTIFESNGYYGVENSRGELLLPARFDKIEDISSSGAKVYVQDSVYITDMNQRIIRLIEPKEEKPKENEEQMDETSDAPTDLKALVQAFNEAYDSGERRQLLKRFDSQLEQWNTSEGIYSVNDIQEKRLKDVFWKALERDKKLTIDAIKFDDRDLKIEVALFYLK